MSTSEARLVSVQEVVLCEKGSDLVEQLVQVFLQWKVEGKPVYKSGVLQACLNTEGMC